MPAFLIPLLLNLAPSVASWVLGDKTGAAVEKVTGIVKSVTGLGDGDAITSALGGNPELAYQLKKALIEAEGEERERQHAEILARLRDVQSAREQTMRLAEAKSPIAWAAPLVSLLAVGVFGGMIYLLFTGSVGTELRDALMILVGTSGSGYTAVLGYWLGSSSGSADKTKAIEKALASVR